MLIRLPVRLPLLTAAVAAALAVCTPPVLAWPWADAVIAYAPGPSIWNYAGSPYTVSSKVLGAPLGAGPSVADNRSVVTLGDGGSITVKFNDPIWDDSRNPQGLDFIVFSNCIFSGGDPSIRWQEPAFVEVSPDGANWYLILPNILPADLRGAPRPDDPDSDPDPSLQDTGTSRTVLRGYAEYTPTLPLPSGMRAEEFYTVPDTPSQQGDPATLAIDRGPGGGAAGASAWAVRGAAAGGPGRDGQGQPIPAHLASISYVRLTDALVGDWEGAKGEISAEIDAVASVMPAEEKLSSALRERDGAVVRFPDAVVARTDSSGAWVHALDGGCGIYVSGLQQTPGSHVQVTGRLRRDTERMQVESFFADVLSQSAPPAPVCAAPGLLNAPEVTPAGMAVRCWGRVQSPGADGFEITDGTGASVPVHTAAGVQIPPEGTYAVVTAGSFRGTSGPSLSVQQTSDIAVLATP